MTRLKTFQPEKKLEEENQDIKKRFKKASLITIKKEKLWIC